MLSAVAYLSAAALVVAVVISRRSGASRIPALAWFCSQRAPPQELPGDGWLLSRLRARDPGSWLRVLPLRAGIRLLALATGMMVAQGACAIAAPATIGSMPWELASLLGAVCVQAGLGLATVGAASLLYLRMSDPERRATDADLARLVFALATFAIGVVYAVGFDPNVDLIRALVWDLVALRVRGIAGSGVRGDLATSVVLLGASLVSYSALGYARFLTQGGRPPVAARAMQVAALPAVGARPLIAWAAFWLIVIGVQTACFHGVRVDDAYITYRYGLNLATSRGFVFNPGELVMGSTSPGQALLSALVATLGNKEVLPSVMSAIGCIGWTAQAAAVQLLLWPALGSAAASVVAVAIAAGAVGSYAAVPLETNLVAAAMLWALVSAVRGRCGTAAALAALAVTLRADAMLFVLVLGVLWVLARGPGGLRVPLVFLAVALAWPVFAWFHFGSLVPQSAIRKFQVVGASTYLEHECALLGKTIAPMLPASVSGGVVVAVAAGGAWLLWRRRRDLLALPAYALLHLAAYAYLRPFVEHTWHLYPAMLIATVLVLSALAAVPALLRGRVGRVAFVASALVLMAAVGSYVVQSARFARTHEHAYWFGSRDKAYRRAAEYFRSRARAGDVIAAVEPGTLGYYSELTMYDWGGLITPNKRNIPPTPHLRWAAVDPLYLFFVDLLDAELERVFHDGDFRVEIYAVRPRASAITAALVQP